MNTTKRGGGRQNKRYFKVMAFQRVLVILSVHILKIFFSRGEVSYCMPYGYLTFLNQVLHHSNFSKQILLREEKKPHKVPSDMRLARRCPRAAASLIYSLNHQPSRTTYSALLWWWRGGKLKYLKACNINKCSTFSLLCCPPVTGSATLSLLSQSYLKSFAKIPSDIKLLYQLAI